MSCYARSSHATGRMTDAMVEEVTDNLDLQLQGHGSSVSSQQRTQHHPTSDRLLAGTLTRWRRGRWSGHECLAQLAREGERLDKPHLPNHSPTTIAALRQCGQNDQLLMAAIACGGGWSWQHCEGHDGSPYSLSPRTYTRAIRRADHSSCDTQKTAHKRQCTCININN